jgi:nucleoid-associated protein YgaU
MGGPYSVLNGSAGVGLNLGTFGIDYAYYYDSQLTANSRHFVSISVKTPGVTAREVCDREEPKAAAVPLTTEVVETPQTAPVEVVKEPEVIEYIVVENDWLSKIAQRYLGDMMRYPEIAELNNIENPDLIFPGQKIIIRK